MIDNPFIKRKTRKPRKDRVYRDGRVYLADKEELRRQVFERSGGRCEAGIGALCSGTGESCENHRCQRRITLQTMELSHKTHGHGFRDDTPESCIASCRDCHQNGTHGSKCNYPRRAGKMMTAAKAREYWRGKVCFCSTAERETAKPANNSFCSECLSKLPAALRHDIENTEGKDYLICLAACETAIMQWSIEKRDSNGHLYTCPEHWQKANKDNCGQVQDSAFPCTCGRAVGGGQ